MTANTVTAPTWATKARVSIAVSYIVLLTAAGTVYQVRATIGAAVGSSVPVIQDAGSTVVRFGFVVNDQITLGATGVLALKLQAKFLAGTGAFRCDASSALACHIDWLP